MVAFGKKLKDRQIEEWQGYVMLGVMNCWIEFLPCVNGTSCS